MDNWQKDYNNIGSTPFNIRYRINDLAYLKEIAPNTEDSAGHIDRLFAQITKSCSDIEYIQGDRWQDIQAHYGQSNSNSNNSWMSDKVRNNECRNLRQQVHSY